ncbi:ATP-binding protein [Amorphoplanes nipponensis]|uniref:ATP-binding protein n=1 Tax=Actinoplanes nipponensis TaxID=135950 RepID=A0A919MRL9_9ACTN|nr:ATP-binding protein [Actinoplanes nipponensis]GIE54367.1 ATP-binding protein [Actinoplanes nipponensis]
MPIDCAVSGDGDRLLAAVSGDLDLGAVADLRIRLLKCLAEQPRALLVDLSRMTVSEPLALSVFTAVRRQAARWPGIPLLLCAPEPMTGSHLRNARHRSLPVFPTVEAADRHVGVDRDTLAMLNDELLPVLGAARQARNLATEACLRWDLPDLLAPASLVASELVSNVVDHAHTMMTMRLTLRPRYLQIAVRDGSTAEPVRRPSPETVARRGRGLMLIEATAHAWGWLPTHNGKVVWASLPVA